MDRRLRSWAEALNLIPASQNGFLPGRRTNSNVFVLRAAFESAIAAGKALYVAFVDLQNSFPSVHHGTLWYKLYNMGIRGPIFNLLKVILGSRDSRKRRLGERGKDVSLQGISG